MIYVVIKNELKNYEADIRDVCLAFFTLQEIKYVYTDDFEYNQDDIVIKDYFNGEFFANRKDNKSEIKRQLYDYLYKLTNKKLLWGTLTGIRPVNIVTSIIEERYKKNNTCDDVRSIKYVMGLSPITEINNKIYKENEVIKEYLKKEYYVSDIKAYELIKIARNEIEILDRPLIKNYKDSYSVYVGVPFCKSTCLYCSFTSFNIEKFGKYVNTYLDTLDKDFSSRVNNNVGFPNSQLKPLTLYIGGGTPTSLDEVSFDKLLTIIDKYVDKTKCIEYTVEAGRPDTITKEKLLIMKRHGVSRISINPQSFNQKTLDLIGRKHTVKEVIDKFKLARELGFDNINMDIILGLPNEHLFDVLKTLNGIRKLKPDSFTVHSLALKRAARLNFELDEWTKNYYLAGIGKKNTTYSKEGNREIDKMFKWSERLAELLKLKPYYLYRQKNIAGNLENVGYAREGKECIYNIMMMSERHSVYGFGTASSKEVFYENNGVRVESTIGYKSIIDYCNNKM